MDKTELDDRMYIHVYYSNMTQPKK